MNFDDVLDLQVTCERSLSPWLEQELTALGYEVQERHATGVSVRASAWQGVSMCLHSRVAYGVLVPLMEFACPDAETLYRAARRFPWETVLGPETYFSIVTRVFNGTIRDTRFPTLKLKDAIVDRCQEVYGTRPNCGADKHRVVLHLNWHKNKVWILVNLAGQKLSDRGYRKQPHKAPMRETLAAAVMMATRFRNGEALVNPMCGSGTLAIEAALMALDRAPGLVRDNYGFKHLVGYDPAVWKELREAARKDVSRQLKAPIVASDHDPRAVEAARANAQTAGVDTLIDFQVCDFAETPLPVRPGVVILNPEYGQRLGDCEALKATYASIGDWFKQSCPGWRGFVFTGNLDLGKRVGLRPKQRHVFENGKIDCRLLEYELYAGRED